MIKIESGCLSNFECDYNVYWCSAGEPVFVVDGVTNTWAQWKARGYDAHSVIANPNFINTVDFVPATRLDYGTNLGTEWQAGLSTTAVWAVGSSPATADQNGTWQAGARIYSTPGGCIPPAAPIPGLITQPTCSVSSGSVALSSLPATGTWLLSRTPGGTTTSGTGTDITITGLPAGSYTFKVTSASGCASASSGKIVINAPAAKPSAPRVGTIKQPTASLATGSVTLSGLPSSGIWTLKRTPGSITTSGKGTTKTITNLPAGATYTFTVTNSSGCTSGSSANVVINALPVRMTARSLSNTASLAVTEDTGDTELSKIKVYPNPVSGLLNIEYDIDSYRSVKILNSSGMLIGKEIAVTPVQQLDFSELEAGLYILEFTKPSGNTIRIKILKN
jgi:hypothetical protein